MFRPDPDPIKSQKPGPDLTLFQVLKEDIYKKLKIREKKIPVVLDVRYAVREEQIGCSVYPRGRVYFYIKTNGQSFLDKE